MDDQDLEDTRQVKSIVQSFFKLSLFPASSSHLFSCRSLALILVGQQYPFCRGPRTSVPRSYSMVSKAFGGLTSRLRAVTSDSSSGEASSPPVYDGDAERRASAAAANISGVYMQIPRAMDSHSSYEENTS